MGMMLAMPLLNLFLIRNTGVQLRGKSPCIYEVQMVSQIQQILNSFPKRSAVAHLSHSNSKSTNNRDHLLSPLRNFLTLFLTIGASQQKAQDHDWHHSVPELSHCLAHLSFSAEWVTDCDCMVICVSVGDVHTLVVETVIRKDLYSSKFA